MHIHNSVRRFRKGVQLAQHELADLLGLAQSSISRIEMGELPDAPTLLKLQVLFEQSPAHLFAGHFQSAGEELVQRAAEVDLALAKQPGWRASQKREWLRTIVTRVTPQPA